MLRGANVQRLVHFGVVHLPLHCNQVALHLVDMKDTDAPIQLQHGVILDTEAAIVALLVAPRVKERKRASIAADQNHGLTVVVGQ